MRPRKALSGRKQAFVRFFAITGNAARAARMAGYKDGRGIWKTAWRLKTDAAICREVERIREKEFADLRLEVTEALQQKITMGLVSNSSYRTGAKALRLAQKVGLFEYYNEAAEDIADLEDCYGVSFRTILATLAEIDADPVPIALGRSAPEVALWEVTGERHSLG